MDSTPTAAKVIQPIQSKHSISNNRYDETVCELLNNLTIELNTAIKIQNHIEIINKKYVSQLNEVCFINQYRQLFINFFVINYFFEGKIKKIKKRFIKH